MQTETKFSKTINPPNLEDIETSMALVGNVWVRQLLFKKIGDKNLPHRHDADHLTLLAHGAIRATVNEVEQDFVAPCMIMVHANYLHYFSALQDNTIAYCVQARRDDRGQVIDPAMIPDGALTRHIVQKYELENPVDAQFTLPESLSAEEKEILFRTISIIFRRFDNRARYNGFTDFAQALDLANDADPDKAAHGRAVVAYEAECKQIIQQLLDDISVGKRPALRSHREVINDFPMFPVKATP